MKLGVVLGGGGLIGMGYHAGALKGLDEFGIDVTSAHLIVGTSAGAVLAGYLAIGWSPGDFYDYAHGRHRDSDTDPMARREASRHLFDPMWKSPAERVRRSVGSLFAVAAARGMWIPARRGVNPAPFLRKTFPAGMYSSDESRARLREDLGDDWPQRNVFICTTDLYRGTRVVFGRDDAPPAPLADAVLASTAIPGFFPPVRIGDRHYVDGGIISATSVDLAPEAGCDAVICVAPLGYRKEEHAFVRDPTMWAPMMIRSLFARSLAREVRAARAKGVPVLVLRPWLEELRAHGTNSMRRFDRAALVDSAREGTLRFLEKSSHHPVIEMARTKRTAKPA